MIKRGILLFVGAMLVMGSPISSASSFACKLALANLKENTFPVTETLISYFEALLANQKITTKELTTTAVGLKQDQLLNPISEKRAAQDSDAQIHFVAIAEYLKEPSLDKNKLRAWLQKTLQMRGEIDKDKEQKKAEAEHAYSKRLKVVPAGKAILGFGQEKREIIFHHDLAVMDTKVTQFDWFVLMNENPFLVDNKIREDHPVEKINWWSAITFANRLSVKEGLQPVYDLSEIEWLSGTSAEKGNLTPKRGDDAAIRLIKINAPNENIYEAEGYRLGTQAEKEYLLRNLGTTKSDYPHDVTPAELAKYAWHTNNAGWVSHPVGSTEKSFIIAGNQFHDLIGNVNEWCDYQYIGEAFPENHAMYVGGSYSEELWQGSARYLSDRVSSTASGLSAYGFRLVKRVKK